MNYKLDREWGRFSGIAAFHASCMAKAPSYTPKKPNKNTQYNSLVAEFNELIDENRNKDVLLSELKRKFDFIENEYALLLEKHNKLVAKHNNLVAKLEQNTKSSSDVKPYDLKYVQAIKSDVMHKAVKSYGALNYQLKQTGIKESLSTKVFYTLNKIRANYIENLILKGVVSGVDFANFLEAELNKEDNLDNSKSAVSYTEAKGWLSVNYPDLITKIK